MGSRTLESLNGRRRVQSLQLCLLLTRQEQTVNENENIIMYTDTEYILNCVVQYQMASFSPCLSQGHSPHVTVTEPELGNHGNGSTGPTPDCSPPSPDTALKNIERVIRPQVNTHTHTQYVGKYDRGSCPPTTDLNTPTYTPTHTPTHTYIHVLVMYVLTHTGLLLLLTT